MPEVCIAVDDIFPLHLVPLVVLVQVRREFGGAGWKRESHEMNPIVGLGALREAAS